MTSGDGGRSCGRTLVFARDVAAANEAADFLADAGLPVSFDIGGPTADHVDDTMQDAVLLSGAMGIALAVVEFSAGLQRPLNSKAFAVR